MAHWPAIDVPALLLSGTSDPFARIDLLEAAMPKLRDGRLVTYPKLGHGLLPVREDVLTRIAAFLAEIDAGAGVAGLAEQTAPLASGWPSPARRAGASRPGCRRSRRDSAPHRGSSRATGGSQGPRARSRPATSRCGARRSGRCRAGCPAADRQRPTPAGPRCHVPASALALAAAATSTACCRSHAFRRIGSRRIAPGRVDLGHAALGTGVAGDVGVMLSGERPVGGRDVVRARVGADAKNHIGIRFAGHGAMISAR